MPTYRQKTREKKRYQHYHYSLATVLALVIVTLLGSSIFQIDFTSKMLSISTHRGGRQQQHDSNDKAYSYKVTLDDRQRKKETSCCPEASWGRLATEQPSSDDSTSCTTTNTATITSSCLLPSSTSSSSSSTSTSTHSLVVGKQLSIGEETNTPIYYSPALPADLSLSKKKKKAIVIIPDVWGPSDRLKRLADSFSQRGYHAIIPDSFRGETKDSHPNFVEWVRKFTFEDVVKKDLEAVLKYLETECNISPEHDDIAIIGFCWGGWVIAKSASEGFPWKCGVSMHPATKLESFVFQRDETAMLEKVNMPWLLLPAGNDEENLKPGSAIVEKLREKGGDSIVFERMVHGWVSRGDIGQAAVREDIDKALDLTVKFIEKNLS